jgi:hypothetical protein
MIYNTQNHWIRILSFVWNSNELENKKFRKLHLLPSTRAMLNPQERANSISD